jgi:hypothetical protein
MVCIVDKEESFESLPRQPWLHLLIEKYRREVYEPNHRTTNTSMPFESPAASMKVLVGSSEAAMSAMLPDSSPTSITEPSSISLACADTPAAPPTVSTGKVFYPSVGSLSAFLTCCLLDQIMCSSEEQLALLKVNTHLLNLCCAANTQHCYFHLPLPIPKPSSFLPS